MSIYEELKAIGADISFHASDLYVKPSSEVKKIIDNYEFKCNVTKFRSSDGTGWWFEIPFAYDPFWNKYYKGTK